MQCANGKRLHNNGEVNLNVSLNAEYTKTVSAIVSDHLSHMFILGTDFIDDLYYQKNERNVIINGIQIQRFMPEKKPILIRAPFNIELAAHERDHHVSIANKLYETTAYEDVIVERMTGVFNSHNSFSICESVQPNKSEVSVLLSNLSGIPLKIRKGTIIAQISPSVPDTIFLLKRCEDDHQEKEDLETFQAQRKSRYQLHGKLPNIDLSNLSTSESEDLNPILIENNLAFASHDNDLGRIAFWRFSIPFNNESEQCYQPPRPIPPGLLPKVREEFAKWDENDLIEEAFSPVNIPVLIVRKPNGSVRLALDARKLNSLSIKDRFPMPNMQEIFHQIGVILSDAEKPFISSFDAKRAYNQLMLSEGDKNKVAFSIFNKHFRAKRLVYGLQNGPSAFSRLMSHLFSDDPEIFVFIDDIIIISKNWCSHKNAIKRLLEKCISIGLVLDPAKCQIAKNECMFLGERITKSGRLPSEKHIKAIKEYPIPRNRKELKRFCGLVVFEQKFIKNASVILKPLHKLSSNKVEFDWQDCHQDSFDQIKSALIESTGIFHRDNNKPLVLVTDASLEAAGGILSQINESGDYEPLGYFSRTFTDSEKRQSARHREAYAIHDAVKHFQYLLLGEKFTIETDHHSLIWLAKENLQHNLNMRMVNVYQFLSGFDFEIKYKANTTPQIQAADALSRAIILKGMDGIESVINKTNPNDVIFNLEFLPHPIVENINLITRAKNYETLSSDCRSDLEIPINTNPNQSDESHVDENLICFRFADNSYSYADMIKLQGQDKYCNSIKTKLDCKCKEKFNDKKAGRKETLKSKKTCRLCKKSKFFRIENSLVYNVKLKNKRLVLPECLTEEFVNFLHVAHLHPGAKALEKIISRNIFIYNIQCIAKNICARCFVCMQTKPRPPCEPQKVSLQPAATYPFEFCAIDLIDHGKSDSRGKRYLLVIVDLLSDFIDGLPLSNKTDQIVSKALTELILRHGALQNVISDNGREFGPLFNSICKKLHLNPIKIAPYNSRANRCERANRCIRIKERLMGLSKRTWSEAWPFIRFQLNHSPKAKLDFKTPFEVAFGRTIYTPFTNNDHELMTTNQDWTKISSEYFNTLYPQLVQFQNQRIKSRATDHKHLKKGEKVLIFRPNLNNEGKISKFWAGPLTVQRKIASDTYELKCDKTKKIFKRNLRHCRPLKPSSLNTPTLDALDQNSQNENNYLFTNLDNIEV